MEYAGEGQAILNMGRFMRLGLFLLTLGMSVSIPGFSQSHKSMTPEAVAAALEKSEILGIHHSFAVETRDGNVKVVTPVIPQATNDDYKINAVLVAKKVAEIYGRSIPKVKVVFVYKDGSGRRFSAVVRDGDIKAFGSGLESKEQLLASIDLDAEKSYESESQGRRLPSESAGAAIPEATPADRDSIQVALERTSQHIKELSSRGVGIKPFQDKWELVSKNLAEENFFEAAREMDGLKKALREEEHTYEEQRHPHPVIKRGHGKFPERFRNRPFYPDRKF